MAPSGEPSIELPGGTAMADHGDIRTATLTEPTERYTHAVLGDGIEAGGIAVSNADGATASVTLAERFVFEDVAPRIADLDGDGRNEVVTVLSEQGRGASLVVLGLRDEELLVIARTPPIGRANRWLNPAGIADFDGDGVGDIALVETPHIGGDLQLWSGASLLAGIPRMLAAKRGYSNHAIGSAELDLAEVIETPDGPVLIVPTADRRALEAVRYGDGAWVTIGRAPAASVPGPLTVSDGTVLTGAETVPLAALLGD